MDKLIGVLFGGVAAVIDGLAGSAILAFARLPRMPEGAILDVAGFVVEVADAVRAVGVLAAIEAAAAEVGGELGDGYAEHLAVHDMVDALLAVGDLRREAAVEPLHYLAQKDTALGEGVEERSVGVAEQLLRQHVEHLIGERGRCEHLIVREVRQAIQHVGIVEVIHSFVR